jgi:stage II sporulation protein GA (sporulation sigma-E factor processing peptidase)
MVVYIDVVLFENIAMNYIILIATAIIGKYKINYLRSIISSFIGSIYAVANYAIEFNLLQNLIAKILISLLMVIIAFKGEKIKTILKQLMLFYLVSFTFGGVAFMLLFFVRPEEIIYKDGHLIGTYPIKIALLGRHFRFYYNFNNFKYYKR